MTDKNHWKSALVLDRERRLISGSTDELAAAIRRGADLRIYTEFRHNEHIDTKSTNRELIKEVADFRVTYLLEDRWVAGIINLRQPIELPHGFGPRPSMSFFLYNQNADQAIARPYLDGQPASGKLGPAPIDDHSEMPKYHQFDGWDSGTNAPSSNFAYDFETYKFLVCDDWTEVYAHRSDGAVLSGAIDVLAEEFARGREVKVGINGLCDDLAGMSVPSMPHEVFVHCGSCYYYTESRQFIAASQPVVRVKPAVPLRYKSLEWDFGWLMPRSDGLVARWLLDPYTLKFHRSESRLAIRWFVR
ncbi:MAG: hypothetical protein JWM11_3936 [Planctomycetaceae bacterium]|nr:hypothetical protein [Planctomycetaceae bacterium]